jgi:PAS domain S-box-containing protein
MFRLSSPSELGCPVRDTAQDRVSDTQVFADVFGASPIGIVVENLDGQPLFVNPAFCSFLGFSEEELRRKHCVDFSPPEDAEKDWVLFQQLRAGVIDHYQLDKRYFRRDGSLVWGRLIISLLKNGPSPRILAMVEDITEEKRAEEARFRHAAVIESSDDAIASGTLDGIILSWNTGAQKIYGYTEAEAIGKPISMLVPPEIANEENKILETVRAGGRIEHFETVRVTKTGKRINVSLTISPIKDSTGRVVGCSGIARDITERKLAEQSLRASEERLRLAQQAARIGTFEWNIQTGVNTWTPELEAMYGLPPGGFGGTQTAFENLVYPDDRAGVIALNNSALKTGLPTTGEWRAVWPDGSVHWIAGRWQVFMNESGEPLRMVGINIDVTERKRAEEKLREYEMVVEGVEDIIGVVDREYRLLLANRQYLKMRNMTREQVVGHLVPDVLNNEIFETVIKPKLDECFKGKVVKYERKFSYPGIGERDLLLSYFPIEGASGTIDRAACISHDITERKQAEDALRASEERLRLAQWAAHIGTFDLNLRTGVDVWQPETEALYGLPPGGFGGTLTAFEDLIHPNDRERVKELTREMMRTGQPAEDEWRVVWPDGSVHWIAGRAQVFMNEGGEPSRMLGVNIDITERKRGDEKLSEMTRKLVEAQEQERARIGRELHDDINQRLAMLALEIEQLKENPSEVETRAQELRKQITEISDDVQALSHDLHSSKLEYLGVVSGIKSWCKEFGERQKMEIGFKSDVASALPLDVGRTLFRLLQEALHNASKHSSARRVDVQLREESGEIHLIVSDTGRGFDVESALQGKGLGLTSMRERVRLVKGTIEIQSKPMGGTIIHVRVPLALGHKEQRAAG